MAPASIVFPDPLFLFQTLDEIEVLLYMNVRLSSRI
jgi:hypothetical protein